MSSRRYYSPDREDKYSECHVLHIKNIPPHWHGASVRKNLVELCKSKSTADGLKFVIMLPENNGVGACLVKFNNSYVCNLALTELSGAIFRERELEVSLDTENLYREYSNRERKLTKGPYKGNQRDDYPRNTRQYNGPNPEEDTNYPTASSPNMQQISEQSGSEQYETYGLSKAFLASLQISLPIHRKIFVGNLDPTVTEAKLREVFSYAGQIMQVILIGPTKTKAKIEFDHPVEAVQAISMFNNQELYGRPMNVQMDMSKHQHKNVPQGLKGFGPGLGPNGEPLRGVRIHLELLPIKNFFTQEMNKPKEKTENEQPTVSTVPADTNIVAPYNPNTVPVVNVNPFIQPNPFMKFTSLMNSQGLQNLQLLQSLIQQNAAMSADSVPMNALAMMQGNVAVNQNSWNSVPSVNKPVEIAQSAPPSYNQEERNIYDRAPSSRFGERESRKRAWTDEGNKSPERVSDMLVFNNLPPSVTMLALNSKMREVGEVKFVEMTGKGRALVRFVHPRDAERCVNLFHESKVDGQTIDVRMF